MTNTIRRTVGWIAAVVLAIGLLPALVPSLATHAHAATCGTAGCAVTVQGVELDGVTPIAQYNFVVNVDNTKLPSDPNALSTESNSPVVAEGSEAHKTVNLPDGRYLISIRATDHKMWGAYVNLPADAPNGSVTENIALTKQSATNPLPLGKIRVFVFNDNSWTNGAPDTEENGLQGFQVGLEEQTNSAVTVDYNNQPICGGICKTGADGFVQINDLGPATYFIDVHPPKGPCNSDPDSAWYQTTTIDGGLQLLAPVEEGSDGTGAPGEQLWEPPNNRTAYWFGFVCAPQPFQRTGTGEVTGQAKNWVEWAPYTTGTFDVPVEQPFVALSDADTDQTLYVGRGDNDGNFDIQNVPAGSYNLSIWDEQLTYIMRFKSITVTAGQTLDVNEVGDDGSVGVGVSRWFGWLNGTVYKDLNNNGQYDAGVDAPIPNTDMDERWRDGSIKDTTTTDANGHYEYPAAEGGALGRWFINEQGFARFSAYPGPSLVDEHTGAVTPSCGIDTSTGGVPANPCIPVDQGGGLLTNQSLLEGHHATVDWGKRDYDPGSPGQIVGITYFATTRNEFDARKQAHEDYEPAIPDVTVYLEGPGPDGIPNTGDDQVLNKYVTDHWQQPNASQDPQANGNNFTQSCSPLRDYNNTDISGQFNAAIGPNCLEVPLAGENTKDGAFDGGYAFDSYCPDGYNLATDKCADGSSPDDHPLVAGTYITHAIMPKDTSDNRACNPTATPNDPNVTAPEGSVPGGGTGCLYRPVKEEDVNVDLGNNFTTAIPDPPCVGDDHVIDQSTLTARSFYYGVAGAHAPLCDKKLVVLTNRQNANADFHMMTNFPTDPNGTDVADTRVGDVPIPGRLVGQVFNDIYFETDPESPWYGEPRPIAGIPVGIYARVDTVPNVNQPYDPNNWRLLTTTKTSPDGSFEALVPSTETFNCPIPQGPCPGMYLVVVDDPGSKTHPNPDFNPNLLYATTPAESWPGLTTQLDLPLDPISGTACEDPAVPARPELLQVNRPYVQAGDTGTGRRITIQGDFIGTAGPTGATGGRVTLTDTSGNVTTLTRANGGVVSWTPGSGSTPDTIVIQVPAINTTTFRPGPKQLAIITAAANGSVPSANGITVHVLGANGSGASAVRYTPAIVNVAAPPPAAGGDAHAIQNAIDGATQNSFGEWPLLVLKAGTYNENVLQWKPVKLQGLGPGGIIGSHELQARDPEDPRFHIVGSVIDGRYFQQNASYFDGSVVPGHAPYAGVDATHPVLRGADLTVVAKSQTAYPSGIGAARIDGIGMRTGEGEGAGGLQLQAYVNNMQVTNDVLENNNGVVAGGIGLGQPYDTTSHNYNVKIQHDRVIGNGGLTQAGGVGIWGDSNNYELSNNIVCSNFSVNYGAGVSHIGLSPNGSIHDNQIYYNEAVDSGGGIAIESELPVGGAGLGTGTGAVSIDRNLIQSNYSGDDGGGVFLLNTLQADISLRNNQIVDNGTADLGGAMTLDDAGNVRIINNTVANNVSTGSSEDSDGNPHSAGLASEANETAFQNTLPAGAPDFSRPAALFNNIFWDNEAFTLDRPGPGASLVSQGFLDFEVHGTGNAADTFTPRYSVLTNGLNLSSDGQTRNVPGGQGNQIGVDPGFVTPFTLELTVSGSRLDPQTAAVTITGADPPVGLTGDYHITAASGAIDRGVRCSNTPVPAPLLSPLQACSNGGIQAPLGTVSATNPTGGDIDGDLRPQVRSLRLNTPWDVGADELPTLAALRVNVAVRRLTAR